MFEVCFGSFWTGFMAIFTYLILKSESNLNYYSLMEKWPLLLFLGLFWFIGIAISVKGIRKIIINYNTDTKGEECYGRISRIYNSGNYVNDRPELKADVIVYIQSLSDTEVISEVIGFDYGEYSEDSYVRVKYYNGDINFEEVIDENMIPISIKEKLDELFEEDDY